MFFFTFTGALAVNPPITLPLLEIIIVNLLALNLLHLVLPDALPHDVGDRGGDQAEMDVNLHSRNKAKWEECMCVCDF